MNKGSGEKGETGDSKRRWGQGRREYACVDGVSVPVPSRVIRKARPEDDPFSQERATDILVPTNGISYWPSSRKDHMYRVFVSAAQFDRLMSLVVKGPKGKTITFPKTGREILQDAFRGTEIERVVLSKTLKKVGGSAFYGCKKLKTIYVEEGCEVSLLYAGVPDSTKVGPLPEAVLGNAKVWDLRKLRDVIIPDGVETIGNYLFWGSDVESITIPESVKEIGEGTFYECTKLKKVIFAGYSLLGKIGNGCFSQAGIEEITIPRNVATLEIYTFYRCANLKKVTFMPGNRLTKICESCFNGSGIQWITIPKGVAEIQQRAFENCKNLKEVTFEEGSKLEKIREYCFAWASIEKITFPKTLKQIGNGSFSDCRRLRAIGVDDGCEFSPCAAGVPNYTKIGPPLGTMAGDKRVWNLRKLIEVIIPDGVEKIGNRWFWGAGIESVTIPVSVREICDEAFYECKQLNEVVFEEGSTLKIIGKVAFMWCNSIRRIQLPDSLKEIGRSAFNCSGLTSFTAPRSLRVLGQGAFWNCENLWRVQLNEGLEVLGTDDHDDGKDWCGVFERCAIRSVILPSTLKRIEYSAFCLCEHLRSIGLPESLEFIGRNCFSQSGLESVEFPASLRTVSQEAFASCERLKTAKFNEGLEALGTDANKRLSGVFQNSAVENVQLPHTLRKIEYGAFKNCKDLRNIELPASFEYAGKECFSGSALESIRLPPTLKAIEANAFTKCKNLKNVKFSEGLEKIGASAFFETGIVSVEFPTSLRIIAQGAFGKCGQLKYATLNEGLKVLGTDEYPNNGRLYYGVFEESAVEDVQLPSTLKRIEYGTFDNCKNLQSIRLPDGLKYVGKECFAGSKLATVRIPKAGVQAGENAFRDCPAKDAVVFRDGRVFPKEAQE